MPSNSRHRHVDHAEIERQTKETEVKIDFDDSLKKVLSELEKLPEKIGQNLVRGALRAGAKVFADAAKQNVPVDDGDLKGSIRVSSRRDRIRGGYGAQVRAGKRGARHAHLVEFGTKPHKIKGPVVLNGKVYRNIKHPGARPNAFMRRTFDANGARAFEAYADYIRKRFDKELAKAARGDGEE